MNFSIIIINYNTRELTGNCVESIFKNCDSEKLEIIVVDNASNDGSAEKLKNKFGGRIKLIANSENNGFGKANNQGAKVASGKYLFFLNSDTILRDDIFNNLEQLFIKNSDIGISAPKLYLEDNTLQPHAFGKFPNLINIILGKFSNTAEYKKEPFQADWVSGAALVIRRELFNQLNGFDEKFFMYFEDIDLCARAKGKKFEVVVEPAVSIVHLCGKSIGRLQKRKKYYYESQDYYFKKHFGLARMYLMKIIRWPYKFIFTK